MKLTGAAILVSRDVKLLQAAPAAYRRAAVISGGLDHYLGNQLFQFFRHRTSPKGQR
jgi:hypothetical protein